MVAGLWRAHLTVLHTTADRDRVTAARRLLVDDWKTTDDRLLYTFTLRRGLKFHDGGDVTTRDVVASLKRMFVRDGQNQLLAGLIDEYQRITNKRLSAVLALIPSARRSAAPRC